MLGVEGEDARIDSRMIKDDRVKGDAERSLWAQQDKADKLDSRQAYQEQFGVMELQHLH